MCRSALFSGGQHRSDLPADLSYCPQAPIADSTRASGRVVATARAQAPQRITLCGIDVGVGVFATTQPEHQAEHHTVVAVQ